MEMSRVPYASAVGVKFNVRGEVDLYKNQTLHIASGWYVSSVSWGTGRGALEAVKRILRYVKGTSDVALCFGYSDLTITGYVDSDYACILMEINQPSEAEYVAKYALSSKEAVWLKMLLEELGHKQEKITLFCDNQSALYLASNPAFHSKTKRIRVQYHFVREKVEEGTVDMQKIHTDDNKRKQHGSARKDNVVKIDLASIESSSGRLLKMKGQLALLENDSWAKGK
ncbi:hypothetical protein Tco_1146122 [Tanacetum coccineum]